MPQELNGCFRSQRSDRRILPCDDIVAACTASRNGGERCAACLTCDQRDLDGRRLCVCTAELGHGTERAVSGSIGICCKSDRIHNGQNRNRERIAGADKACHLGGIVRGERLCAPAGGDDADGLAAHRCKCRADRCAVCFIQREQRACISNAAEQRILAANSLRLCKFGDRRTDQIVCREIAEQFLRFLHDSRIVLADGCDNTRLCSRFRLRGIGAERGSQIQLSAFGRKDEIRLCCEQCRTACADARDHGDLRNNAGQSCGSCDQLAVSGQGIGGAVHIDAVGIKNADDRRTGFGSEGIQPLDLSGRRFAHDAAVDIGSLRKCTDCLTLDITVGADNRCLILVFQPKPVQLRERAAVKQKCKTLSCNSSEFFHIICTHPFVVP